jgi:hypothetical protein
MSVNSTNFQLEKIAKKIDLKKEQKERLHWMMVTSDQFGPKIKKNPLKKIKKKISLFQVQVQVLLVLVGG